MSLIDNRFGSVRRPAHEVRIGSASIGGRHPVLVQSMTTTLTRDVKATVEQTLRLAEAGCELVRITTPTQADAACLEQIVSQVRSAGCSVPLCADIHFQPAAAFEAVKWVEKVRVNPGNFVDAKTAYGFQKEFDDSTYDRGLQKISDKFRPLVRMARERGVALRIGTNHGSLSDRILARYGDTPEGMVVSALEYLSVCEDEGFDQVVFSMKASNPKIVVQCYRILVDRLDREGRKPYPIHLGVTEAGEGRDGRLKSAVGIGSLLLDGIGDTIRVSLTEDPVLEIPVAADLVRTCVRPFADEGPIRDFHGRVLSSSSEGPRETVDPHSFSRRHTMPVQLGSSTIGLANPVRVGASPEVAATSAERPVEWLDSPSPLESGRALLRPRSAAEAAEPASWLASGTAVELHLESGWPLQEIAAALPASNLYLLSCDLEKDGPWGARRLVANFDHVGLKAPLVLRWSLDGSSGDELRMAATLGGLLIDGYGDAVCLDGPEPGRLLDLSYDLLQAAGARRSKAEFISCPSCGRTLFDLVTTSARIRAVTGHLKDVSIAIMGCIVNGPGEMADADFGYVGGTPGSVNLYVRRDCVRRGVPEAEAPEALVALIREHGKWVDPA
ncbi:MAG: (E)-4-hydroxy-3-methylbut-2-enyl-diphosphate synthase [Fibrobacteria bacterium]|nr:(E)-4-hydroxy-3-methylbut-2-enyl-diphosphate synthase [Fibrobacteria bacterium]